MAIPQAADKRLCVLVACGARDYFTVLSPFHKHRLSSTPHRLWEKIGKEETAQAVGKGATTETLKELFQGIFHDFFLTNLIHWI